MSAEEVALVALLVAIAIRAALYLGGVRRSQGGIEASVLVVAAVAAVAARWAGLISRDELLPVALFALLVQQVVGLELDVRAAMVRGKKGEGG